MIIKLASRNIWRSKLRSLVVIAAIAIGIWALLFLLSFSQGMVTNYIDEGINTKTSHIQIHHPSFKEDRDIKFSIDNISKVKDELSDNKDIKSFTFRTLQSGMISSSKAARGVSITGIDVGTEKATTSLASKVVEGNYFEESKRTPILISTKLAERLNAKMKSKLVLTFQNKDQEITAGSFRVVGLFKTSDVQYDESNVFIKKQDLLDLTGMNETTSHEVAIVLHDIENIEEVTSKLKADFPDALIEPYGEISPDLALFTQQMTLSLVILTSIFMLALIFGIINTMLMAVLERIKELGMLMAIGMNKTKVFFMIVCETILLALIGGPIGIALAWLTIKFTSTNGINLAQFSGGLEEFGMSTLVYPSLKSSSFLFVGVAIMITAVLASLYPARKAIKLKPVDALRSI